MRPRLRWQKLGGGSRLLNPTESIDSVNLVVVPTTAVDEVVPMERPIALIHLDVEGHEKAVLSGARRILERWRPDLIVETLPDDNWMREYLIPLGYELVGRVCDNHILSVSTTGR